MSNGLWNCLLALVKIYNEDNSSLSATTIYIQAGNYSKVICQIVHSLTLHQISKHTRNKIYCYNIRQNSGKSGFMSYLKALSLE